MAKSNQQKKPTSRQTESILAGQTNLVENNKGETPEKFLFHYPNVTDIEKIVDRMSQISEYPYVLSGSIQGKVRIYSPSPVTVSQALDLFEAALGVLHLRAVMHDGIVKIVKNDLYKTG